MIPAEKFSAPTQPLNNKPKKCTIFSPQVLNFCNVQLKAEKYLNHSSCFEVTDTFYFSGKTNTKKQRWLFSMWILLMSEYLSENHKQLFCCCTERDHDGSGLFVGRERDSLFCQR